MDSTQSLAYLPNEKRLGNNHKCSGIPCRYKLSFLGSFGFMVVYALRVNLSVTLVAMINSTSSYSNSISKNMTLQDSQKSEEFHWNEKTQGIILGSFFYGYLITQLPGGWLASKFGGKHVYGLGVLCATVFTFLTPWAAKQGVGVLIAVRIIEGIGEGVTFPAMQVLLSSWAPPLERSKMTVIVYAGSNVGNIFAQPISGILCASGFLGGWPSVFYVFGALGIVWYISWILFVFEKPTTHPRISKEEKEYILKAIGSSHDKIVKKHHVPWLSIIKSPPVYAIIFGYVTSGWGYYTSLTALPTYFKDVLEYDILQDGLISSIPYAVCVCCSMFSATIADWLLTRQICSVAEVRRLAIIAGTLTPACLLVATSYVGHDGRTLGVVLISLAVGSAAFQSAGPPVNILDIAPRFSGMILGIANSFATISGLVSPLVTGWLTNDRPTRRQWQKVFYISAAVYVIGAIGFILLSSGQEQSWNTPEDEFLQEVDIVREPRTPLLNSTDESTSLPTQQYQSINRV